MGFFYSFLVLLSLAGFGFCSEGFGASAGEEGNDLAQKRFVMIPGVSDLNLEALKEKRLVLIQGSHWKSLDLETSPTTTLNTTARIDVALCFYPNGDVRVKVYFRSASPCERKANLFSITTTLTPPEPPHRNVLFWYGPGPNGPFALVPPHCTEYQINHFTGTKYQCPTGAVAITFWGDTPPTAAELEIPAPAKN